MTFEETPTIELKRMYTPALKKEIVAFANTNGGTIYIGVEDDGNVIGVPNAHEVEESVNALIHNAIVPDLSMFAEAHCEWFDDVELVVVTVHKGPNRPYCIEGKGMCPEGVYVRQGTSAQPLSYEGIRRLLREVSGSDFESERSLEQNLSFEQAERVFGRHEIAFEAPQMRSLGVVGDDGLFTNLGLLLSDQCPFSVKVARFKGSRKAVFQTRREICGSALAQVDETLEMLDMLNDVHAVAAGAPERREWRSYPPEALREAVLNALVHRDYEIRASVGINVYDDRCEVVSPGGLPRGSTEVSAFAGVSVARNAGLAAIFYRLRWIEAYGTGLAKIRESYGGSGLEPDIDFLDGAVKVVLPDMGSCGLLFGGAVPCGSDSFFRDVPSCCGEASLGVGDASDAARGVATAHTPGVSSAVRGAALSEDESRVLEVLSARNRATKSQVASLLGLPPRKTAEILRNLVQKGQVEALGTTRNRVYRCF